MWLPPGFLFFERVGGVDFVGVRKPVISMSHRSTFEAINRHLLTIESPSPGLQRTLDQIIMFSQKA
eukprot:10105745-Lingulodinium_polyedra.AAC.1